MAETPKDIPLRAQLDQEALKKIGRDLIAAFETLGAQFKATQKQHEEAQEVAALFTLYWQMRNADRTSETQPMPADAREMTARLHAALHGYDPEYLVRVVTFCGWLLDAASKEWQSR